MQMAHVNEVELIGRVVGQVEKLKTASGQPFVKMKVETERFVRSATGQRERLAQTHTVVIREKLSVPVMSEHATEGVIVRIVGELTYSATKVEIVVWDHLGQAKLMQLAERTQSPKSETAAAPPPRNTGGLGRLGGQKARDANEDGGDHDLPAFENETPEDKTNDFLNSSHFEKSNSLDDDIPF